MSHRTRFSFLAALAVSLPLCFALPTPLLAQDPQGVAATMKRGRELLKEGNGKEAYDLLLSLLLKKNSGATRTQVRDMMTDAFEALQKRGDVDEKLDKYLAEVVAAHPQNYHVLNGAAHFMQAADGEGSIKEGVFHRGNWGGKSANSSERDRVQSRLWMREAAALVMKDPAASEVDRARQLLREASYWVQDREAWQLQALTDLSKLPEVEVEEEGRGHADLPTGLGYPANAAGGPVYFQIPESWEAAKNDGERWRYLLQQAALQAPSEAPEAQFALATQLSEWLEVTTLRGTPLGSRFTRIPEDGPDANETAQVRQGVADLATLKENETITRLATGVKRHTLPTGFVYMEMLKELGSGSSHRAPHALQWRANSFENRQQLPEAAAVWRELQSRFGKEGAWGETAQTHLQQIESKIGRLEPREPQPAGAPAKVSLVFRNAESVEMSARRVKLDALLDYVRAGAKALVEGKKPKSAEPSSKWVRSSFDRLLGPVEPLTEKEMEDYLEEPSARWTTALKPAPRHGDRRVTLDTPLRQAGVYLLEANFPGGQQAHCLVILTDLVAFTKPRMDGKGHAGFVVDAITGNPVPGVKVTALGVKTDYRNSEPRWFSREERSTTDGQGGFDVSGDKDGDYQWLLSAKAPDGRLAIVGFGSYYRQRVTPGDGMADLLYVMTDRPVYRPGQTVHLAGWARQTTYELGKSGNVFAGDKFICEVSDPRGEKVLEQTLTADHQGALAVELSLGSEATLGHYRVRFERKRGLLGLIGGTDLTGYGSFRVEEYKKPEFEVKVKLPEKPVMLGDAFTATVEAGYYFGGPVQVGTVHYKVERTAQDTAWFPARPWDWLYGPGYWWRNSDYSWLGGHLGCIRHTPSWWPRQADPPEIVAEGTLPLGQDGKIEIPLDTALTKELHGNKDHRYQITAEVTDASRRTIVGSGSVVIPRKPYQVYVWLDKGFHQAGEKAKVSVSARMPDGRALAGKVQLRLLAVHYTAGKDPEEVEKGRFQLRTKDGEAVAQILQFPQAGTYQLVAEFEDEMGHRENGIAHTTVRGPDFDGKDLRFPDLEVVSEKPEYAPGEQASFMINLAQEGGTVLVFERPVDGTYSKPRVVTLAQGKSTTFTLPVQAGDQPNFFLEFVTVRQAQLHSQMVRVPVPPAKRVAEVSLTASQETYKPREEGTVQVRVRRPDGTALQGRILITGYDKALEYISGGSNVAAIQNFFWGRTRQHQTSGTDSLDAVSPQVNLPGLAWMPLGAFGSYVLELSTSNGDFDTAGRVGYRRGRSGGNQGLSEKSVAAVMPAPQARRAARTAAMVADSVDGLVSSGGGAGAPAAEAAPLLRQDFADALVWQTAVQTDAKGMATVPLTFPDDLTTWKLRAWAMGPGTEVGEAEIEVITRKDLLVRLQAPRFFVEQDEVVLSGVVHNAHKMPQKVRAVLELDGKTLGPLEGQTLEQRFEIPAGGEHRFDWQVKVLAEGEATVRMKALAAAESDAVEKKFPVYVHGMLRQEAWSLALRPDQGDGVIDFKVPEKRRPAQTRLEVRYSPSLAAAMVDALPYLVSYPHGCTEQTLNRFVPTVVTLGVLRNLKIDLKAVRDKRSSLNAQELGDPARRAAQWQRFKEEPVFDEGKVEKMAASGVKKLLSMQAADGGWGWWPGEQEGSVHLTAQVVEGLMQAREAGAKVPEGAISRGLDWLQTQEAEVLALLRLPPKSPKYKLIPDDYDALAHCVLVAGGKGEPEMRERLYEHRMKLAKSMQAALGLACHKLKETTRRDMILRNLEQYQKTDDENQTAWLDLGGQARWWAWSDDEVETQAAYLRLRLARDPADAVAPGLVKHLLNNRKHGTYWRSTRDTAAAIRALADYVKASGEAAPDMMVELVLDGKVVKEAAINAGNLFTFDHAFVLSGEALSAGTHKLEVRRKGKGPLYVNAYLTCFNLEDRLMAAGLEVKVDRRLYKLVPEEVRDLVAGADGQALLQDGRRYRREPLPGDATVKSGDLLEVELVVTSKNDYEYLMLEDFKAAGCEAFDLQSGYARDGGLNAYREFRDEKTTFYLERLPQGRHTLTYRLRAEIPGKFSALPAAISGMYAPELKGNSDEVKVRIGEK